jgi:rfaE bifunctional protein nucleotidyltransferase chain/domain
MIMSNDKLMDLADFKKIRGTYRKLLFTNGCFDILHAGHVNFLKQCRELGDYYVIVGLNSDKSVRELKGDTRPINTFENRAYVLHGLSFVDLIIKFNESTPLEIIKELSPDILVKGQDWETNVVGKEFVESYGGKVVTLPLIRGLSTTITIEKIQRD